nr:hypothetical protein [Kineococcus vitellinus]
MDTSGPCCAATGSIHITCRPWPSSSKELREETLKQYSASP